MVSSPKKQPQMMIPLANNNLEESGESLVKSMNGSFFDDPKVHSKVFVKNIISLLKMQENNFIYSKSIFAKKLNKAEEYKNYFFFLTENGIYYSKVRRVFFLKIYTFFI